MWIKSLRHPFAFAQGLLGPLTHFVRSRFNRLLSATAPRQPHASPADCAPRSPYGSLRCSSLARRTPSACSRAPTAWPRSELRDRSSIRIEKGGLSVLIG